MKLVFKSLNFWIVTPILLLLFLLGFFLYTQVLSQVSEFAEGRIRQNLRETSRRLYLTCDNRLSALITSGRGADVRWERVQKGLALGDMEDFVRINDVGILVSVGSEATPIMAKGLPATPEEVLALTGSAAPVTAMVFDGRSYYATSFEFSPWDWNVTVLEKGTVYEALLQQVQRTYFVTAVILGLTALLLLLLLRFSVYGPIESIIKSIRQGKAPSYRGIAQFEYLSSSIRDMQSSLKERTEWFNGLVSTVAALIVVLDEDNRIHFVNRTCEEVTGRDETSFLGKTFWEAFLDSGEHKAFTDAFSGMIGMATRDFLLPIPVRSGDMVQILWRGTVVDDPLRNSRWSLVTGVDISDRIEAERSLQEAEEKYRTIFENAVDGIFQTTAQGRFLSANPAMARIMGYETPEELIREVSDIKSQMYVDPARREEFIRKLAVNNFVSNFEARFIRRDGVIIWGSLHARPVYDDKGSLQYLEGSFQDISQRKKAEEDRARLEEQLRQSQKMEAVGTLAGGIAHDFNNLLQAISGHVQLLLLKKAPRDEDVRYLEVIDNSVLRASELVRQLLTFSRKTEPRPRLVDMNALVNDVLELIERTIPKMVRIEARLSSGRLELCADPVQLEQVLVNLINNSCDAMPQGGTVTISTEAILIGSDHLNRYLDLMPGHYVLLTLSDTGTGMDEETQKHIFEPFYTTKPLGSGTGIGLSTVYGIVTAHNGAIHCYSQPRQGSTFKVYLPVFMECTECGITVETSAVTQAGSNQTILLVDDEESVLDVAREVLSMHGYTVFTAGSGEEALKTYTAEAVDLTVLDLGMPGIGGEACLRRLIEIDPGARVVLASGYGAHKMAQSPEKYGAAAFLSKPYRVEDLLRVIQEALTD